MIEAYIDGACSGNPGSGAAGFILLNRGQEIYREVERLPGKVNSNICEFYALEMALNYLHDVGVPEAFEIPLPIYTDSQLVYLLMSEKGAPRNGDYIPYFTSAYRKYNILRNRQVKLQIYWIPRERNQLINGLVQKLIYSGKYKR